MGELESAGTKEKVGHKQDKIHIDKAIQLLKQENLTN